MLPGGTDGGVDAVAVRAAKAEGRWPWAPPGLRTLARGPASRPQPRLDRPLHPSRPRFKAVSGLDQFPPAASAAAAGLRLPRRESLRRRIATPSAWATAFSFGDAMLIL